MSATQRLDAVFGALANTTRRDILDRLTEGTLTAGVLAASYPISDAAVSRHLRVLEHSGLVVRTPRAQWREISVRTEALDDAAAWVNQHHREWTHRLDLLEARIEQLNRTKGEI